MKQPRRPVLIAVIGLLVIAAISWVGFNVNDLPLVSHGTTYTAYFTEAAGLEPGNTVRIAGVTVGTVSAVSLDGAQVKVSFEVKNAWVGDDSTVAIDIETILGEKYLDLDPLGPVPQDPAAPIPAGRTTSPYDVTQAFQQLGTVFQQVDTTSVAKALEDISATFANTPPAVHQSLTGLAALSQTIASQDSQIATLLQGSSQLSGTVASEDGEFQRLIDDGNLLLAELEQQQQAIGSLLTGTEDLSAQLTTLVKNDDSALAAMLGKLGQVTTVLQRNQANLQEALQLAGPYTRLTGNLLGSGPWFDTYLCGLIPQSYGGTQPTTGCEPPR
ncbi:MAG TPA: MCE family protein [Trebonia sp.]|jgi:phospholipid/cholesterol/gamma-HCH transport system substrate-binding protein|nr:MCE family protein [Trebonia sp.]